MATNDFTFASEDECRTVLREITADAQDVCGQMLAADAVGLIMDLFPAKDINNPETFLEYAVMSLVGFPADVVAKLAHPQYGIARDCKFLPSIAELVQWCDREMEARKLAKANASKRLAALNHRNRLSNGPIINNPKPKSDGFEKLTFASRSMPKEA